MFIFTTPLADIGWSLCGLGCRFVLEVGVHRKRFNVEDKRTGRPGARKAKNEGSDPEWCLEGRVMEEGVLEYIDDGLAHEHCPGEAKGYKGGRVSDCI